MNDNFNDYIITVQADNMSATTIIMLPISAVNEDQAKALANNILFHLLKNDVRIDFVHVSLVNE